MKRKVICICVLFLMCDLAEDGCLGKAKFVSSHSSVKYVEVSSEYYGPAAPDYHHEILWAYLQVPHPQFPQLPKKFVVVQQSRKIIFTSHLSSAGGLPRYWPSMALTFYNFFLALCATHMAEA